MIQSGGRLVLAEENPAAWSNTYHASTGVNLTTLFASYARIYKTQQWVYTVVKKRALAARRLPVKVYRRTPEGRVSAADSQLAVLLRTPNQRMSGSFLWEWTASTFDIYGEAIWFKVRGRDGRPGEVLPVHPTNVTIRRRDDGDLEYLYGPGAMFGTDPQLIVPERDVVHFKSYNPESTVRGLSPLEPLRQTLVNEDGARRANAALWRNGGRPSVFLRHPGNLSEPAGKRLKAQWDSIHSGVDNWAKAAVLEEGMEVESVALNAEELQYVESRRLNREEVCAVYDVPPPVVHILDRATFSNIVEQMRSMYRDTMAPLLSGFEATIETQLAPDFGDPTLYAEFLMDDVLRGDFEQRVDSYQKGINSGWLTVNEVRELENLPAVSGGDVPRVNAALKPMAPEVGDPVNRDRFDVLFQAIRAGFDPESAITELGLPPIAHTGLRSITVAENEPAPPQDRGLARFWGSLGRCESLEDITPDVLAGLNGHGDMVRDLLDVSRSNGETVAEFRARVRAALT